MAQVTLEMEAFSFEVPDIKTLIINLDGGGTLKVNVESLRALSEAINATLAAAEMTSNGESFVDSRAESVVESEESEGESEVESEAESDVDGPVRFAFNTLNMQAEDSFEEIETQQLY